MKKVIMCLVLFLCVFALTGCGESKYLKKISYQEYQEKIENKESFVLEVTMDGCTHCEELRPKLTKFVDEYKTTVYYIDESELEGEDLIAFKDAILISGTPTILFYNEGVEETVSTRIVGAVSYDKIVEKFKNNGVIE